MKSFFAHLFIWIFALVFSGAIMFFQKCTGPTYPMKGTVTVGTEQVDFSLIRSADQREAAQVTVPVKDTAITGELKFRRYKSHDAWTVQPMTRQGDLLAGTLPHLDTAGKVMYEVTLVKGDQRVLLNNAAANSWDKGKPAVLRYKGYVPGIILAPHVICMILAFFFSTLTALMAIFRKKHVYVYAWITVITLAVGGLILGPIVQKYAFGAYWTGWPFGNDLTDNKSLLAFLFWVIALVILARKRQNRVWPVVAALVLQVVFLIPHSVLGSEIDYTKEVPATSVPAATVDSLVNQDTVK